MNWNISFLNFFGLFKSHCKENKTFVYSRCMFACIDLLLMKKQSIWIAKAISCIVINPWGASNWCCRQLEVWFCTGKTQIITKPQIQWVWIWIIWNPKIDSQRAIELLVMLWKSKTNKRRRFSWKWIRIKFLEPMSFSIQIQASSLKIVNSSDFTFLIIGGGGTISCSILAFPLKFINEMKGFESWKFLLSTSNRF